MKQSLVSINLVTKDKQLLNPAYVPILLYWNDNNGNGIPEEFFYNEKSHKYTVDTCCNVDLYTKSQLSFFYFKDVDYDGTEDYQEGMVDIQTLFEFDKLEDFENVFYKEYIVQIFDYLYECSFKEKPIWSVEPWKFEDDVVNIYKTLQEKYPRKIEKLTIVNYFRSEFTQKYKLNTKNSEWIIVKLENILKNEK
jgi:hypothetical protein